MSDSPELLKPGTGVTDSELQIKLGNLKAENETLKNNYAALLESSTRITNKLREEVREVRSQLAAEQTRFDELREELENAETLRGELQTELSDLKQNSAPASKLDKAQLLISLNRFKDKYKKSNLIYAQMKDLLEMIEKSCDDTSR